MNAANYGDNSPDAIGSLHDNNLFQRVITGITYKPTKWLIFEFHMQDSRAFEWSLRNSSYPDLFKIGKTGTEYPFYIMNPNEAFFEIHDASIEYKNVLENLDIKFGRQKIFFGDHRIFGPGEWGNTGRWTWDALLLSYTKGKNFIDVFAGGTKINDPEKITIPFTNTEFWGGGVYAHYELRNFIKVEPFYAMKTEGSAEYANTLNFNRHWIGTRFFNNDFHFVVFDFTAAKEFGKKSGKKINAYGIVAKAGYQFHFIPSKPILSLRESYASGGKKTDNKILTFEPAFGSRDSYYGRINITKWSNLDDREIDLELFPSKDMWVQLAYNWFYIPVPDDVTLLNTIKLETDKLHLGNEMDLFVRYQVQKHWQIIGAYGYFWPGDLKTINNQSPKNAQWFALQVLFTI